MTPEQITLTIAIWGAATGTVALVLQYLQHRADRPDLRITAHLSNTVDVRHPQARLVFALEAVNHGRRPVRIERVGVELPPKDEPLPEGVFSQSSWVNVFDTEFGQPSVELGEGAKHTFRADPFPIDHAKTFRTRETAFVEDSRGQRYTTQFYTIRPENLPKPPTA
jgi:hypothetical protein